MVQKIWSNLWKSSTQKRKQRKYLFNSPLHVKHRIMNAHLSKELKTEYNTRSVPVRKGDTVTIMSGQFKNQSGKVSKVSLARMKVYVEGISTKRMDGSDALYPVHPSNLMITKLDTTDKARVDKLKAVSASNKKAPVKKAPSTNANGGKKE